MISEATEDEGHRCDSMEALAAPPEVRSDGEDLPPPPPAENAALLMAAVRRQAARALGVEAANLPLDRSLLALGLDSLAAAELAGTLADEAGVDVPLSDLLAGPTVAELCARVSELIGEREDRKSTRLNSSHT